MIINTETEFVLSILSETTPGPWQADAAFCKNGHPVRVAMPDWAGVPQASIAECYHNWNDADCGERRISWREAEANARFIAAARDLVPALLKERDALRTRIDELEAFITDFASAKFDSLPLLLGRHPADEPDPVTDATVVWSWQEDANELLKGEKK